eukprot:m.64457 g.64457  ORF g.64457 m.64457 type:complete len:170 (+) comp35251_c0_seq1:258-767(+)
MIGFSYDMRYYFELGSEDRGSDLLRKEFVYELCRDPRESPNDCPWLTNEDGHKPLKTEWANKVRFWFGMHSGEDVSSECVTHKQICVVSKCTFMCWRQLGYALGFSSADLLLFDEKSNSSLDKVHLMLDSWKDRLGREATLKKLVEACGEEFVEKKGAVEAKLLQLNSS